MHTLWIGLWLQRGSLGGALMASGCSVSPLVQMQTRVAGRELRPLRSLPRLSARRLQEGMAVRLRGGLGGQPL